MADEVQAFVSSANFTEAAQLRNIEVGVLIRLVAAGFDLYYGRRLGSALRAGGLKDVQFEGRVQEWGGTRRGTGTWLYLFQRFRDKIVADGALSPSEADEFIALVEHPSFSATTPIFYGAYARRPG